MQIMKQLAKISGISYLLIFLFGFYANFAVLESLIDPNSPTITATNFLNTHGQFRYGLIGFALMLIFDLILVWSLFGLTKPTNKHRSYLASIFRLLHALFFAVGLSKLWKIYQLTTPFRNTINVEDTITELLASFDTLWTIGLTLFGVHLIILGSLFLKSIKFPKVLGILLILAGSTYIIDGVAKLSLSNYLDYKDTFEIIVILPTVIGELSLTLWLLIKGFNKHPF